MSTLLEEKVKSWAEAQAEDQEIEGSLVIQCKVTPADAAEFVREHEGWLQHLRWDGRRKARSWMYEAMQDVDGKCKLNGSQLTLLQMFLKAHCGHAKEGVDEKVREVIRDAERKKARSGGGGGMRPTIVPKAVDT